MNLWARAFAPDLSLADVRSKGDEDAIAAVEEILWTNDAAVVFVAAHTPETIKRESGDVPFVDMPIDHVRPYECISRALPIAAAA